MAIVATGVVVDSDGDSSDGGDSVDTDAVSGGSYLEHHILHSYPLL